MKKTFEELGKIDVVVGELYQKDGHLKDSKFGYAYKRFSEKNYLPKIKELQQELNDARIDNALEDPITHAVWTDSTNLRGYKYSKEGLKAVMKKENELLNEWNKKEFEIDPYISEYVPELTEEQRELLKGVLI